MMVYKEFVKPAQIASCEARMKGSPFTIQDIAKAAEAARVFHSVGLAQNLVRYHRRKGNIVRGLRRTWSWIDRTNDIVVLAAGETIFRAGERTPLVLTRAVTAVADTGSQPPASAAPAAGSILDATAGMRSTTETTGGDEITTAHRLFRSLGRVSLSHLQRRLGVSYNRALGIVEELERRGLVGPEDASGRREVRMASSTPASDREPTAGLHPGVATPPPKPASLAV